MDRPEEKDSLQANRREIERRVLGTYSPLAVGSARRLDQLRDPTFGAL